MTIDRQRFQDWRTAGVVESFLLNVVAIAWQIARLLIVALLILLEPILGFVLCGLALVGVIVSVILKFSGSAPKFPFLVRPCNVCGAIFRLSRLRRCRAGVGTSCQ